MHCYLYYLQLMQVFIYSVNAFMHSSHAAGAAWRGTAYGFRGYFKMYVYYINVCYIHFLDLYIERTIGNELSSVDRYCRYCDDTDAPFPLKSAGR